MLLKVFCLKHYLFISAHRCKIIFLRHFKSKTTALFKNIALCLKNKVKFIIVNFNAQNAWSLLVNILPFTITKINKKIKFKGKDKT